MDFMRGLYKKASDKTGEAMQGLGSKIHAAAPSSPDQVGGRRRRRRTMRRRRRSYRGGNSHATPAGCGCGNAQGGGRRNRRRNRRRTRRAGSLGNPNWRVGSSGTKMLGAKCDRQMVGSQCKPGLICQGNKCIDKKDSAFFYKTGATLDALGDGIEGAMLGGLRRRTRRRNRTMRRRNRGGNRRSRRSRNRSRGGARRGGARR